MRLTTLQMYCAGMLSNIGYELSKLEPMTDTQMSSKRGTRYGLIVFLVSP